MEQKFDTKTVLEVYQKFKTAKDNQEIKFIDNYLKAFQKSREAWVVTQEILKSSNIDGYTQLQSATILKQKIEYDFAQLQQQGYANQAVLLIGNICIFSYNQSSTFNLRTYQKDWNEEPSDTYSTDTWSCV